MIMGSKMLDLYDTNNWARIKFETDTSGLPLRTLFHLAFYAPQPAVFFFDGFNAKAIGIRGWMHYCSILMVILKAAFG